MSSAAELVHRLGRRAIPVGTVAGLLAVSGIVAVVLVRRSSTTISHHVTSLAPTAVIAFLTMWLTMVVAMMLPTALPMVIVMRRVDTPSGRAGSLVLVLVAGYVAVWLAAGAVALVVDVGVREALSAIAPSAVPMPGMVMPAAPAQRAVAGGVLLAAGLFQLTPLAAGCVRACRSPFGFFARGWRGGGAIHGQAFGIGLRYGASCLGCCGAAMAVLLLVGMEQLSWMAAAGAVMAVQKTTRGGPLVARALGAVLGLAGVVVLAHAAFS